MKSAQEWIALEDAFQPPTYARNPAVFESGDGIWLYDTNGKRYADLYGGHCVAALGHTPSAVSEAIKKQGDTLFFYSNVAYLPIRGQAAEKVISMAPEGFDKVFFCNSGTEANENALKIAWKLTGKKRLVATKGGWHGRTLASLAVTDDLKITSPYATVLPPVLRVPFGDAAALRQLLKAEDDIGAFILEPIQSIAGITTAPPEYFQEIRQICDEYGVFLIFDEIQTGVGRTGKFSYSEWLGMKPDLITFAKSLAAGFPIGAVLMPERVSAQLKTGDLGSTFAGGPLACAACIATLQEVESRELMENNIRLFEAAVEALTPIGVEVRGAGALIGIKLPVPAKNVVSRLFEAGWVTGTSADPQVMRLMPPYITPPEIMKPFAEALKEALQ
jgi:acetylornithine/succinyldiaminopimelate/putrescine aminotransferase